MEILNEDVFDVNIANITSKYVNKLVKMKVMVSKVGPIKNEYYANLFRCPKCFKTEEIPLSQDTPRCSFCNLVMKEQKECIRDFKEIEVEEVLENLDRPAERMKCKITGSMLDTKKIEYLQAGEIIELIAWVEREKMKQKIDRVLSDYYLLAEQIKKLDEDDDELKLTEEDIAKIKEISKNNPIEKLRDSLAPGVFGYDNIKTALLLQMVRGSNRLPQNRPLIHILLCGDASVAKSALAKAVHNKSPRSVYGSGEGMSKTGLICTFEKDDTSGRWGVRAGSICRAHRSLMIIDELDKLNDEDKKSLHSPMEDGIVKIDRVGIHAELPASTCILGCCNPKKGKFNTKHIESIQSQINLTQPLLTRFDLIYILKDKVELERDTKIFENMYSESEIKGPISDRMFKKYIKYASKIEPSITPEAKKYSIDLGNKLRQAYLKRQNIDPYDDESPFSFRQGGGIVRLAYASAKLRLSDKVEVCDFELAEEITMDSLSSLGFGNKLDGIEYNALYGGTTSKKQSLIDSISTLIKNEISQGNRNEDEIKKKVLVTGIPEKEFDKIWNQFRKEGTIVGSRTNISYMA